jgi:3-deoxy-manno-octulosonate cytidylyltransferase (CMP-KDO synthetase)
MIQRVWERCIEVMSKDNIFVATEDDSIKEYCSQNNINCIVTQKSKSAIDRIKHFSDLVKADYYINVQGDEPIININDIKTIMEYGQEFPERVVFGKCAANETEFSDISKAKVVCDRNNKLLYSSRAGIPITPNGKFKGAERAIWIYGFPKYSLDKYFDAFEHTRLDKIEDNEIIRFLEIGIPVYCVDVIGDSWAVDESKDIPIVEDLLRKSGDF